MHEDAVVVVSLVLPVDPAAVTAVTAASAFGNVEERLFGMRIVAEIGKRRRFQADQRGLILSRRTLIGGRWRQRGNPVAGRLWLRRAFRRRVVWLTLHKRFIGGREAIAKLGRREAVDKSIPRRGLRIGGQHCRGRRLTALNENERQRDQRRQNGDPAQSGKKDAMLRGLRTPMPRRSRRRWPACAIKRLEFRPDHPPNAQYPPAIAYVSSLALRRR
jgi:hypothetical protein